MEKGYIHIYTGNGKGINDRCTGTLRQSSLCGEKGFYGTIHKGDGIFRIETSGIFFKYRYRAIRKGLLYQKQTNPRR